MMSLLGNGKTETDKLPTSYMGNLSDKKCGGWAGDAAMVLSPMVTACWPGGCGLAGGHWVGGELQPDSEISQQGITF
jgi:hypothetical protein